MASFSTVQAGDPINSTNLNQIIDALAGNANVPISITGVNDASLFALDVRNQDATNQRSFRVRNSSGDTMIQVDDDVTLNQVTISSGTITGSTLTAATITGSTVSMLAASSNVMRVPSVRSYHTSTQTLSSQGNTTLIFNTDEWDNDTLHSTSAGASSGFRPSRTGLWSIGAIANVQAGGDAGEFRLILQKNAANNIVYAAAHSVSTVFITTLFASAELPLSTPDTVSMIMQNLTSTTRSVSSGTEAFGTAFWMTYRGAT